MKIFCLSNSFDNNNGDDGYVGADENDKRSVIRGYNNEIEQKAGFHEIGLLPDPTSPPSVNCTRPTRYIKSNCGEQRFPNFICRDLDPLV